MQTHYVPAFAKESQVPITVSEPTLFNKLGLSFSSYFDEFGVETNEDAVKPKTVGGYTRTWNRTPDFFARKKNGEHIAPQGYTYVKTYSTLCNGTWNMRYYPFTVDKHRSLSGVINDTLVGGPYWLDPAWHYNEGIPVQDLSLQLTSAKLLDLIKDQKVNLAQCFAERKQTADLIASTARRLASSYTQLRHGNLPGALNSLGAGAPSLRLLRSWKQSAGKPPKERAASTWLEIQYGWKPLLADIYGSCELLAQVNNERPIFRKVSYSKKISDSITQTSFTGIDNDVLITRNLTGTLKAKQSVTFSVTNQAAKDISGTGISNPLELAWELLPYSFVVDWFLPVGSYLSAFDATAGLDVHSRTLSWKQESRTDTHGSGLGKGANVRYTGLGSSQKEFIEVGRQPLSGWPPNLFPQFKNPLSMVHVANALALLTIAFRE